MEPSEKQSTSNKLQKYQNVISLNAIFNQEVLFDDDNNEKHIINLSVKDLNNKIQTYTKLYRENKINVNNAFQIDLISCMQQMVKKTKHETNFLDISFTFDAIGKVYSCRVDDFWATGIKLIKEFSSEILNTNRECLTENKPKPHRKKLMLTTPDKLCYKENEIIPKKVYSKMFLGNKLIDYAKPSRVLINTYYNEAYWPEYNTSQETDVNRDQEVECDIEEIGNFIKTATICPEYDKLMAEFDYYTNDDNEQNKFDNITSYSYQDKSHSKDNHSEEPNEPMDTDIDEEILEQTIRTDPSCSNSITSHRSIDTLDSITQLIPTVDTHNDDNKFSDLKKMCYCKCTDHRKGEQRASTSQATVTHDVQTDIANCTCTEKCKNVKNTSCKVNFNMNLKKIMKKLKNKVGDCACKTNSWKIQNEVTVDLSIASPVRKLNFCNFLDMVPEWYENELTPKLNNETDQISISIFPNQNIPSTSSMDNVMHVENFDNTLSTEINDENNSSVDLNKYNIHEELVFPSSKSGYIDVDDLKKCILKTIKPDNDGKINITFKDILCHMVKFLPENIKDKINAHIVLVALLHLCNEHGFHLKNDDNNLTIVKN